MHLGLDGRVVLVTGSTSGLGRAAATVFAIENADMVVTGRDAQRLDDMMSTLRDLGAGTVHRTTTDLTNPADIESLVKMAGEEMRGFDHLVVSTGGPLEGLLGDSVTRSSTPGLGSC